jgi:hypothetical protein
VQPQAGGACSSPGRYCGFDCELPIVCDAGVWQWGYENCPICAAPDTPIATPEGERPIAAIAPGDLVYSVESDAIVVVPVLRVGSTAVTSHHVIRLVLDSGRSIEMSPGHPTAEGIVFSQLVAGQHLDPSHIISSIELIPYAHARTHDILPASSSGAYFAAGALVGSTFTRRRADNLPITGESRP